MKVIILVHDVDSSRFSFLPVLMTRRMRLLYASAIGVIVSYNYY